MTFLPAFTPIGLKREVRLAEPRIGDREIAAVNEVLRSGRVTQGERVAEFEDKVRDALLAQKHAALMVNSGSSACMLAAQGLRDLRRAPAGSEVITTPMTWSTDVFAMVQAGLKPVFVDVDESMQINLDQVKDSITEKTIAIAPVHLLGWACDMRRLMGIAKAHNLLVWEDCCEAFGTAFDDQYVGTFGDFATFSFYLSHHLSCGPDTPIPFLDKEGCFRIAPIETIARDYAPSDIQIMAFDEKKKVQWRTPSHIIKHPHGGKRILRLKLEGDRRVEITEDHSVFAWDGEIGDIRATPGSELRVGTFVAVPKRTPSPPTQQWMDFEAWCRGNDPGRFFVRGFAREDLANVTGGWRSKGGRKRHNYAARGTMPLTAAPTSVEGMRLGARKQKKTHYIPSKVDVSTDLARFFGFFMAEGSYTPRGIQFSFGIDEEEFANDVADTARRVFGLESRIRRHEKMHSLCVGVGSYALRIFMEEFVGIQKGARNKRIPSCVYHFDDPAKVAFLYGMFRGDGHRYVKRPGAYQDYIQLSSGSRGLLNDTAYLCSMLGLVGTICRQVKGGERTIAGRKTTAQDVFAYQLRRTDFTPQGQVLTERRHDKGGPENHDRVPLKGAVAAQLVAAGVPVHSHYKTTGLSRIQRLAPQAMNGGMRTMADGDLCLLPIVAIEQVEPDYEDVYDFSVPGDENFVGGTQPICLHNSSVEGGMLFYPPGFIDPLAWREHGWIRRFPKAAQDAIKERTPEIDERFLFSHFGWNVRSTEINAAIGLEGLRDWPEQAHRRQELLVLYEKGLSGVSLLRLPPALRPGLDPNPFSFPIRLYGQRNPSYGGQENGLSRLVKADLEAAGVETRSVIAGNITRHPWMRHNRDKWGWGQSMPLPGIGFEGGRYVQPCYDVATTADSFHENGFLLPLHAAMSDEDVAYVCDTLKASITKHTKGA